MQITHSKLRILGVKFQNLTSNFYSDCIWNIHILYVYINTYIYTQIYILQEFLYQLYWGWGNLEVVGGECSL